MLEPEQILQNRYQIKQKLGENAARQTWLANDLENSDSENAQVVVKLLCFGGQFQWENLKLFEREAQVIKQLNHPQIPNYRDYFCIDDRFLWFGLVEDYIPGSSFKELLHQGKRFSEQQVRKIAVDVLNILVYLHELNPTVLHRDIKPSNLIFGEDKQIYLVDFGAVQDTVAKEGGTFTVVGTYGYTPMEQFGGRAVPASDLYALGATLIHLLTGTAPADLPQRDLRIQFSDKVSISPSLVAWIEKLTEPAFEKRFGNARQAREALQSDNINSHHQSTLPIRSSKVKIHQPLNTRVKLHKTPLRLEIHIPPGKIKLFINLLQAVWIGMVSLIFGGLTGALTIGILIWIISIFLSVMVLPSNTYVEFNYETFEIKEQSFNFTYSRQISVTSNIQDVSLKYGESKPECIIITSNYLGRFVRYSFGRKLSEAEMIWLAQEIREWLESR